MNTHKTPAVLSFLPRLKFEPHTMPWVAMHIPLKKNASCSRTILPALKNVNYNG